MSKVMAILVMCESDDLGGIVSDFFKQFQNGNEKPEINADYVKPLVVSDTAKQVMKAIRSKNISEKILDYITENKYAVAADLKHIAENVALYTSLNQLVDKGLIVRQGERGSYRYELANIEEEN